MEHGRPGRQVELTGDLLHQIFSFLQQGELCQAALVCRQWRQVAEHEDFWRSLNFEGREVERCDVVRLCRRYPRATLLNLHGVSHVDGLLARDALHSLRSLTTLILGGHSYLSDSFFRALEGQCPELHTLRVTDAVLGSGPGAQVQEIQVRHNALRVVELLKCLVLRVVVRCPILEFLSLRRTGASVAQLSCPLVRHLDLSCLKLSDAGLRATVTSCPLLEHLDISHCGFVSDETLRDIGAACPQLTHLNASRCPNIALEGVRLQAITHLQLYGCEGLSTVSMAALSHCLSLEELVLDACHMLVACNLQLPHLQTASMASCKKLMDINLRSPALAHLNVHQCSRLSQIHIASHALVELSLCQQKSLATLSLSCPNLRQVDLSDCESLTNDIFEMFCDGGGCPQITTLMFDNCEGVTEVKLQASKLELLSLVGCRSLALLDLACPLLHTLDLDGCDHLAAASLAPIGLRALNLGICPHLARLTVNSPQMEVLDLRGCGGLEEAALCCTRLTRLDASYCSRLSDACLASAAQECPSISMLVLAACPAIGTPGLSALAPLRYLSMLDLSYTFLTDLSAVFEVCVHLRVLRLSACKYLEVGALAALHHARALPLLRELDMSYGALPREDAEDVLALCPHLTYVSLNGCSSISDDLWPRISAPAPRFHSEQGQLALQEQEWSEAGMSLEQMDLQPQSLTASHIPGSLCETDMSTSPEAAKHFGSQEVGVRMLQILSCVGCPGLHAVLIPPGAACSQLTSLSLSLSSNLREVHLSCPNLTSLNLSNCTALAALTLDCPRLASLCLQGCALEAEVVQQVVGTCLSLETLDLRNCPRVSLEVLQAVRGSFSWVKRLYNSLAG